jgi:hypothetical protein
MPYIPQQTKMQLYHFQDPIRNYTSTHYHPNTSRMWSSHDPYADAEV